MAEGSHSPLEHVIDHKTLEIPGSGGEIDLPNVLGFQVTRFMVMELLAALLILAVAIPLARHMARNLVTRGKRWNIFEAMVLFIRDAVARPSIDVADHGDGHGHAAEAHGHGHADDVGHGKGHAHGGHLRTSDAYLPFLWTLFFFILFCNLLGMLPGGASATGNVNVTAVLAILTLVAVITAGMRAMGPLGFWVGIVPRLDVPGILKPLLWGLMFLIEVAGLLVRHIVLSVRLFANMLAGHIVLAVILSFIALVSGPLYYLVMPASVLGMVALSLLELFVAFLQAYIFTFLTALFIGSVTHQH